MKTIQIRLRVLALALFVSAASFLSAESPIKPAHDNIRTQITNKLQNPALKKHNIEAGVALIKFTLNKDKEVVLLRVDSSHPYLKKFVQQKLKNQQITVDQMNNSEEYTLRVAFQKG